jgi:hypothetical protein
MPDRTVTLPASALDPFPRFTRFNSPYAEHERGHAVDLYPGGERTPSPVSGEVVSTKTVRAPPRPYAPEHDHLVVVRCDGDSPGDTEGLLARLMHVDPVVSEGDHVAVGDELGSLVRAGFFAPWVDRHLHVGFRPPDADPLRASGSLPLALDVDVRGLAWDGTGTVVDAGETYAVLDAPTHPDPGTGFVGVAADGGGVLDGGLRHYDGGGHHGPDGPVSLLGTTVGEARDGVVDWRDVAVFANGERVTGLSLFCARDGGFGAKLVCPDVDLAVGTEVAVGIEPTDDPIVLS